jgi:hypothetical protein
MSLEDEVVRMLRDATETDPGKLQAEVFGPDTVLDSQFLDSIATTTATLAQIVRLLAHEIDTLRAAIEPPDVPPNSG